MTQAAEKTAQLLAILWERNRPVVEERIAYLDAAFTTLHATLVLPTEEQAEAAGIAHKLAGTLGMFGYPRGTDLARMMEEILEMPAPLTHEDTLQLVQWLAELKTVLQPVQ